MGQGTCFGRPRGGPRGHKGVNRHVKEIPWGHWVCLMGFLMIHKAYGPVSVALFDMPNLNRFDILSISIFCKIALLVSIFSKITISISISIFLD